MLRNVLKSSVHFFQVILRVPARNTFEELHVCVVNGKITLKTKVSNFRIRAQRDMQYMCTAFVKHAHADISWGWPYVDKMDLKCIKGVRSGFTLHVLRAEPNITSLA